MQLVIDIPKEMYAQIKSGKDGYSNYVHTAIRNGTPLPKYHGDLIDRKELLKQPMDKANCPSNYVRIAPTIIEADTTENRIFADIDYDHLPPCREDIVDFYRKWGIRMKAVNVDDVLQILNKYGKYIFVTDEKRYSSMVDEIANLKPLSQETTMEFKD